MKILVILLSIYFWSFDAEAQLYSISGKVEAANSHKPLSYANIRVLNSTFGTAANINGEYELKLNSGKYFLIASYIGFESDTISVNVIENLNNMDFHLSQTNIDLPEIVIRPGENPAIEIIRKAIRKKEERNKKINTYEFNAYTKGIIKTQDEIDPSNTNRGFSLNVGINDTVPLKITGILENESKGFFQKPDNYKEVIIARKQTANFPPQLNIFAAGRLIQNFYENNINIIGKNLPAPLSNNALEYYYFYIKGTTAINDKIVYCINMSPLNNDDPGFVGDVFISDSSYDLLKIDLQVNRAANPGNIFDSLNIFQKFAIYDSIYMPADYRIFVKVNYFNLAKFGFELNSILYNYKINTKIGENIFDKAIVTVLPDADKKNEAYWKNVQSIPNTSEEKYAYKRIDSLKNLPESFWDDFSPFAMRAGISDNFSLSAPLGIYHFNKVEGNALDFGFFINQAADKRLNSSLQFSYGFSDKRFKSDFFSQYSFGDYRTYDISLNIFNKLKTLFDPFEDEFKLASSVITLFSKYDTGDYYYTNGFQLILNGEVFPVLSLNAGFLNHTDKNGYTNSDFSILNTHKKYYENQKIYETKINALTAGFKLDFRDYIEDGFFRKRALLGNSYVIFQGNLKYSNRSFLKSGLEFAAYSLQANGRINTFKSTFLNFKIHSMIADGKLPYQLLYSVQGNIDVINRNFSFRTLRLNEILGDKIITLNLEYNWQDEIFRFLKIPFLRDMDLRLKTFFNAAYSDIGSGSKSILNFKIETFKKPFYEAGFGLGHILIPFEVEFAWKLNHRGKNNFSFGISSILFL